MSKLKSKISMSFTLFLGIAFCGIVSCVIICQILISYNEKHLYDVGRNRLNDFVDGLSYDIERTGFPNGTDESVADELYALADNYHGRVILTDSSLKVTFDSYRTKTGKTVVAPELLDASSNKTYFSLNEEARTATYACVVPSRSNTKDDSVFYIRYTVSEEMTRFDTSRRFIRMIGLCLCIIIFTLAIVLSVVFTRPLRRINSELTDIGNGKFDERVNVHSNRQVSDISESINRILERTHEMEENRQNFVSDVSHELKTPMTSMKILADALLSSGEELPEMVHEFLTDINSEIDRENHIISDLLALARMDRKTDTIHYAHTHINDTLDVILNRVEPLAESKEVEVVCESYRDIYADVDEPKIITAITNLVENAILYNRPNGSVYVKLNANMNYFFVTVRDTGYGIAENEIAHIFERFYRVDKDRSRETGGTGLGLAITKEVVNAHGGQIKVYSKINEGTTFSVRIPLLKPVRNGGKE
ncbi:MAG: HAMP domain-containing histidine kinase [Lachnospiraceae bacterium]|nr:HAMP domain-containing histidine kinase [Lachnospiraceae bacterium]